MRDRRWLRLLAYVAGGDSGEAERTFRDDSERHSGMKPDIVRAAKSPYDLAQYVGSHTNIDWTQLWAAMGNVDAPPEYLPACEDRDSCSVKILNVPKPSQVIVVVDHLLHSFSVLSSRM